MLSSFTLSIKTDRLKHIYMFHYPFTNTNQKKSGKAVLISGKSELRARKIIRGKERH